MKSEYFRTLAFCLIIPAVLTAAASGIAKDSPDFVQITPADVYIYEYDWTPDSQGWIATAAHGSGDANWYVAKLYGINAHSGEMREIYPPKWQIAEPHISPDGKHVAFIEGLMSDEGVTGGDLFVVATAGGPARNGAGIGYSRNSNEIRAPQHI